MIHEMTLENGELKQRPVPAAEELKNEIVFQAVNGEIRKDTLLGLMPDSAVIEVESDNESVELNLYSTPLTKGFEIRYDKDSGYLSIDRGSMTQQFNEKYGADRRVRLENGLKSLQIFVDRSSVEIFVNDGEYVLSSRDFPMENENLLRMGGKDINITIWSVNDTVKDDFVIFKEDR